MASAASDQSTFVTELIISTPTQIRAVAVALLGMSWAMGLRNIASTKHIPVTKEVKPVLPPATTPEEDSTNVVTVEVPAIAPVQVAIASASIIFSIRIGVPSLSSRLPLEHAPYRVPMVSNISIIHKDSAEVISTTASEPPELVPVERY